MAVVTQTIQDQVTELYLGFFNRAPDAAGFGYWTQKLAAGTATPQSIANEFAYTPEFVSNYAGLTPQQQVNKIYNNVLNRNADGNGLAYWSAQITAGTPIGTVVWNIVNAAFTQVGTPDGLLVQNKVTVGEYFAITLASNDGALAKTAYNLVTSAASSVAAAEASLSGSGGSYILTTGVDLFTGGPNANFIADNTVSTTLNAADVLTGVGSNNTLKVYSSGAALSFTAANITGIQNMYVNGNSASLDVSAISGLTNLTLNATDATGGADVVTLAGQSLTLSNSADLAGTLAIASTTDTTENITLSKVGTTTSRTIDLTGTKVTSATFTSSGTLTATQKNTFTLANAGAKLATLNIAGASAISLTEDTGTAASVKTINASAATGSVTVDTSNAAKAATFAYTGGSGNDKLTLAAGDLAIITNGSQLNGGSGGVDTLVVKDTSFTASTIAKLNATVGWDVLGFGAGWSGSVATIDFNHFNVAANGTYSLSGLATGSTVDVTASVVSTNTLTLAGAVGVHDVAINIGTATGSGGIGIHNLIVTGLTTIELASLGDDTSTNTITTLTNSDSTTITLTGANDLKITNGFSGATSVGSVLDASAYTGNLTLGDISTDGYASNSAVTLGTSGKGDLIDIGTGAAVLVVSANNISNSYTNDEITLGSTGVDKIVNIGISSNFVVPTTGSLETVNGYGLGLDIIYTAIDDTSDLIKQMTIGSDATDIGSGVSINANGLVTAGIGSASAFLDALASTSSNTLVALQTYVYTDGTDTYVATATGTTQADWTVIELAGVVAQTGVTLSGTGAIIS